MYRRCIKYPNFAYFPVVETLQKGTVFKAFPENFYISKLGKITVFYTVSSISADKKRK